MVKFQNWSSNTKIFVVGLFMMLVGFVKYINFAALLVVVGWAGAFAVVLSLVNWFWEIKKQWDDIVADNNDLRGIRTFPY